MQKDEGFACTFFNVAEFLVLFYFVIHERAIKQLLFAKVIDLYEKP